MAMNHIYYSIIAFIPNTSMKITNNYHKITSKNTKNHSKINIYTPNSPIADHSLQSQQVLK